MSEIIAHYRIVAPLGEGREGLVYRAEDTRLPGRMVALKLVGNDALPPVRQRECFLKEVRAAAALFHPHLRTLYEVGETHDGIYLAMEYLEGMTLKALLVSGPLEPLTALEWGAEIAEALAAAHAAGLTHRALKPASLFVTTHGTIKVLDLGMAALRGHDGRDLTPAAALAESGLVVAALSYLAPEQVCGQNVSPATDQFALGVVVYEMLTGTQPFAGRDSRHTVERILHHQPPPLAQVRAELPPELDATLAIALAKEPGQRYPSVQKLADVFRSLAAAEQLPRQALARVTRRFSVRVFLALAALILLALLWFVWLSLTQP